jgi:hypothetical protein
MFGREAELLKGRVVSCEVRHLMIDMVGFGVAGDEIVCMSSYSVLARRDTLLDP